ncbi:FlgD immunoglobulin-like domain containing protein [candidate division KSB1 bacterium]
MKYSRIPLCVIIIIFLLPVLHPISGYSCEGECQVKGIPQNSHNQSILLNEMPQLLFNKSAAIMKAQMDSIVAPLYSMMPKVLTDPALNFYFHGASWFGDINGDGSDDIIFRKTTGDDRTPDDLSDEVYKSISFMSPAASLSNQNMHYDKDLQFIGDFDGDGFGDALDKYSSSVFYGSASGLTETSLSLLNTDSYWNYYPLKDVDGDGKDDIFMHFRSSSQQGIRAVLGDSTEFRDITCLPAEYYSRSYNYHFLPWDFDSDGADEIFCLSSNSSWKSYVLEFDVLDNNFYLADSLDYASYVKSSNRLNDFNGDAKPDLWSTVENESETYDITVIFGQETSPYFTGTEVTISLSAGSSSMYQCGDLNNDGYSDLCTNDENGDLVLLFGNASVESGFTQQTISWLSDEGASYSSWGDFNGDEYDDILLNYIHYDSHGRMDNIGTLILYGGSTITTSNVLELTQPYEESGVSLEYGNNVVNLGDVNGDGYEDWGISAQRGNYADIFFGGSVLDVNPDATIKLSHDGVVYNIEGGDINEDGYSDVLIGRMHSDPENSKVFVYFGGTTWSTVLFEENADLTLVSPSEIVGFGYQIKTVGDYNADGFIDFVVSGVAYPGADSLFKREAYLYFGGSSISSTPDLTLTAEDIKVYNFSTFEIGGPKYRASLRKSNYSSFDNHLYPAAFGKRFSDLGDVNGDGYDDFGLLEKLHPNGFQNRDANQGRLLIYFGGPGADAQYDFEIPSTGSFYWGFTLASNGGDFDGDGYNDIAISPVIYGSYNNIEVYRGGPALDSLQYYTITCSFRSISALSFVNELSRQGKDDLVVSTGLFSTETNAYVYYGGEPVSRTEPDMILQAPNQSTNLGGMYKFAFGDFNKNNKKDLILGQSGDLNVGEYTGGGSAHFYESPYEIAAAVSWAVNYPAGWSLVSLGVEPANTGLTTLFPDAISLFGFNDGYVQANSFEAGKGYWLNLGSAASFTQEGSPIDNMTLALTAGWHMIGSISYPLLVQNLTDDPAGSIVSIYKYDAGYSLVSDVLQPGSGYWIKLSQGANITFSSGAAAKRSISVDPAKALREESVVIPIEIISDAGKSTVRLFITDGMHDDEIDMFTELFEIPPVPPSGIVDARIEQEGTNGLSGLVIQETDEMDKNIVLSVPHGNRSLIIRWDNTGLEPGQLMFEDGLGGIVFEPVDLAESNSLDLSGTPLRQFKMSYSGQQFIIKDYSLLPNYPNPFNPVTTITYSLKDAGAVNLAIYNILGQEIRTLVNTMQKSGKYSVKWDGTDNSNTQVAGGVYIYRLQVNGKSFTKKMILLK